jgi:hypothetical protein
MIISGANNDGSSIVHRYTKNNEIRKSYMLHITFLAKATAESCGSFDPNCDPSEFSDPEILG